MSGNRVLVVVAHPDDEVLGCGGTIAMLTDEGYDVRVLFVADGVSARDSDNDSLKEMSRSLKNSAREASRILGARILSFMDFPDQRLDAIPLLDIVASIERALQEYEPDLVFTHSSADLNLDHLVVRRAVMTATRPGGIGGFVQGILTCEILSSTEWGTDKDFRPSIFNDITAFMDRKISAMKCYSSELRQFPHPRSVEGIKTLARYRGMQSGVEFAEAFEPVRITGKRVFL